MRSAVEPEGLEVPSKAAVADALTLHTCLRNCFGHRDMAAGCCMVADRDYLIGPIPDADALLARLSETSGRAFAWDEVFLGFEEGRALFPDRPQWQRPECYPAIRVRIDRDEKPCIFLGEDNLCTIHDIRSVTCARYHCAHLQGLLDAL